MKNYLERKNKREPVVNCVASGTKYVPLCVSCVNEIAKSVKGDEELVFCLERNVEKSKKGVKDGANAVNVTDAGVVVRENSVDESKTKSIESDSASMSRKPKQSQRVRAQYLQYFNVFLKYRIQHLKVIRQHLYSSPQSASADPQFLESSHRCLDYETRFLNARIQCLDVYVQRVNIQMQEAKSGVSCDIKGFLPINET